MAKAKPPAGEMRGHRLLELYFDVWQRADPKFRELARALPHVPLIELADNLQRLALEEAQALYAEEQDQPAPRINLPIRVDWLGEQENRRSKGKPGPKVFWTDDLLLELAERYERSGKTRDAFIKAEGISPETLDKARRLRGEQADGGG